MVTPPPILIKTLPSPGSHSECSDTLASWPIFQHYPLSNFRSQSVQTCDLDSISSSQSNQPLAPPASCSYSWDGRYDSQDMEEVHSSMMDKKINSYSTWNANTMPHVNKQNECSWNNQFPILPRTNG